MAQSHRWTWAERAASSSSSSSWSISTWPCTIILTLDRSSPTDAPLSCNSVVQTTQELAEDGLRVRVVIGSRSKEGDETGRGTVLCTDRLIGSRLHAASERPWHDVQPAPSRCKSRGRLPSPLHRRPNQSVLAARSPRWVEGLVCLPRRVRRRRASS